VVNLQFIESSGLPFELASRGFYDANGEFAADFVNEIYKSDAAV
jgi:hypothetical protein